MVRLVLSDARWRRIEHRVPGRQPGDRGVTAGDNRLFGEAVLWLARTGAPWRDPPAASGNWNGVFRRSSRRAAAGVRRRPFEALADGPDFEPVVIEAPSVRAHRHAAGGRGGPRRRPSAARAAAGAPGPTSPSTRPAMRCACGSPPVNRHGMARADAPVAGLPGQWVIADTASDGDGVRRRLADRGTGAVIPSTNPSRAAAIPHDRDPYYRERHLVECSISKIKPFRRIATRYEETARHLLAMAHIACAMVWLR